MKCLRLLIRTITPLAMPIIIAALSLLPLLASADGPKSEEARYDGALAQVTISLTEKGIAATPRTLEGGNYFLTIHNDTSQPRAIEMISIDRAASPTVRFTKVLQAGQSQQFRWYFAKGRTVYVRDVMGWTNIALNAEDVTFGDMRRAISVD
jgi:hypothetical protein